VTEINEQSQERLLLWRQRNVLHVGCDCGDLLAAVEPAYGVGVDTDPKAIELAKKRFGHLNFHVAEPHDLQLDEKFDYVLICNSLGRWHDIQKVLEHIHPLTDENTRIVITYYNHLWEAVLSLGSLIGIRQPYKYQNWLPADDIENLLKLSDFDVIRSTSYLMMPKRIWPLTAFFNYFLSLLPGFRFFNLVNLVVARPKPIACKDEDLSVSVIVPCRNERGNVEDAIKRIPQMGRETEIIFVDGSSTDGTAEEIQRQIERYPDQKISLIHQGDGVGKGDAVRKGFAAATGDVLVIQDADLTAPPEDLPKFFKALRDGKGEYINGSRLVYPMEKQAMRFLNLLGNKFFGSLFSWLLGQRFRDTLCGTKMIRKKDYELIAANRSYFGDFDPFGDFDLIFGAVKQNLKVAEVPVTYRARVYGTTNISRFRHGWLLIKMSWIAFKKIKWLGGITVDSAKNTLEKLKLLPYGEYAGVNRADPLRFYYWPVLGGLYRRRVELCLDQCSGGQRVLEVGFGSGVTFLNLSDKYEEIYGIDLTAEAEAVSAVFKKKQIKTNLQNGNVMSMPYEDNYFDTVLLISILEHLKPADQQLAFQEIRRVLKPGGQVVYGVPIERGLMVIMFRLLGYDIREHHFSTEKDVLSAAQSVFDKQQVIQMKSIFGPVYEVGHFIKADAGKSDEDS
jgi:ubiquinone/menaquinone biosynthesis C-methylase UbiE